MSKNTSNDSSIYENEVDLLELSLSLWKKRNLIIMITAVCAVFSILYSLSLPNIYTSKSLLMPVQQANSLSKGISSISAISSFTRIPSLDMSVSKSQEGVERIQSFEFFSNFILPNINLENLMAVKKWNKNNNSISYHDEIYNKETDKWKYKGIEYNKPSSQQAFEIYESILHINHDLMTSFIYISIDHQSPYIAKKWLDLIIYQINESMRSADQQQAKKSITFLSDVQQTSSIQSIKEITTLLLKQQMQTYMLTSSGDDYVFKIIDSPLVPEKKSRPSRATICILGTIIGGFFSILVALVQIYRKKNHN